MLHSRYVRLTHTTDLTLASTWMIKHWRMPLRRNTVVVNLAGGHGIDANAHAGSLAGLAGFARVSDALILTSGLDDGGVGGAAVKAIAEEPLVNFPSILNLLSCCSVCI